MAAEDFNNDAKDAGEMGAGHMVTALYEIVPRGKWKPVQPVDPLKYKATEPALKAVEQKGNVSPESADDLFTVKLRYKQPDAAASVRTVAVVVDDIAGKKVTPSRDLLWSASVASFGMQLRHSQHAGTWTMADVLETARCAKGDDTTGRRGEFVELVKATMKLMPTPHSKKPAVGFWASRPSSPPSSGERASVRGTIFENALDLSDRLRSSSSMSRRSKGKISLTLAPAGGGRGGITTPRNLTATRSTTHWRAACGL